MHAANGGGRSAGTTPVHGIITVPLRSLARREFRLVSQLREHTGTSLWSSRESIGRALSVSQTMILPEMSAEAI
jgi:hypothetical protein